MAISFAQSWEVGTVSRYGSVIPSSTTPTIITDAGLAHSGSKFLRVTSTGTADEGIFLSYCHGYTSTTLGVGSFYVRFSGLSALTDDLVFVNLNTAGGGGPTWLKLDHDTHKIFASKASPCDYVVTEDIWHRIDYKFNVAGSTWYLDYKVDGTAGPQYTQSRVADTTNNIYFEVVYNTGYVASGVTVDFDDFVGATESGDYPIGSHKIERLVPNADGTHNSGTVIKDQAGNIIDGATYYAYSKLIDVGDTSTYVVQTGVEATKYCEIQFEDTSQTTILGACVGALPIALPGTLIGWPTAAIVGRRASTDYEIFGQSGYDFSDTGFNYQGDVGTPGGGWTASDVNGIRLRFGYESETHNAWKAAIYEAELYVVYRDATADVYVPSAKFVVNLISGTLSSSSKHAYTKGLSTSLSSKSAYLKGGIVSTSFKYAYIKGGTGVTASKYAYLKGKADSISSKSAYLKGSSSAVNSKSAYLKGKVLTSSSKYAYLRGGILTSSSKYAYLRGGVVSTSSKSAYLKGQASTTSSKFAYIKGQTSTTSSKFAYLKGSTNVVSSKTAYLRGGVTSTTSKYAFLRGKNTSITNKSAYTKGSSLTTTSKAAYLKGQSAGLSSKTAYLKGLSTGVSSKHAYLTGGLLISSSKGVYLFGDVTEPLTPDADVSVNGWINEVGGGTLFPSVADALDTNYATYNSPTGGEYFEVSLSTPEGDPDNSNDHIIVWRAGKLSADGTVIMKVQLRMGGSLIAEYSHLITQSYQTFEDSLSQAEIDSITDYTTLSLRFYVVSVA